MLTSDRLKCYDIKVVSENEITLQNIFLKKLLTTRLRKCYDIKVAAKEQ